MKIVYWLIHRLSILPFYRNSEREREREREIYIYREIMRERENLSDLNFDILVILNNRYNDFHSRYWNKLINVL